MGLILFNSQRVYNGFSLLPVTQPESEILLLANWPWSFFRITDGAFLFLELGTGFILAILILGFFHRERGLLDPYTIKRSVIIYALSALPLALAGLVNNYLTADFQSSPALVMLVLSVIALILVNFIEITIIKVHIFTLLMQLVALVYLNASYSGGGTATATDASSAVTVDLSGVNTIYALLIALNGLILVIKLSKSKSDVPIPNQPESANSVRRPANYRQRTNYVTNSYQPRNY